jgi:hypothetical protein
MAESKDVTEAVKKLKQVCDKAADGKGATSCSHAVWSVMKDLVDSNTKYAQANELIRFLNAESSKWIAVSVSKAGELANCGELVIGGKTDTPNGHVIVVYPGALIAGGGYQYFNKKENKYLKLPLTKGMYPRCLSTSSSTWPGTKSKGDKTVWDPWASDANFKEVKFWTRLDRSPSP